MSLLEGMKVQLLNREAAGKQFIRLHVQLKVELQLQLDSVI